MEKLFGTDGIRGLANTYPMDVKTAMKAGRALAQFCRARDAHKNVILIGQDTRLSGDMIAQAVGAGICSAGMNVTLLGVLPTPAVAYLTHISHAAAGVVISASHNPYADNGIKIFNSNGYKLADTEEGDIQVLMSNTLESSADRVSSDRIGSIHAPKYGLEHYLDFLEAAVPDLDLDRLKIVLDCANGATFQAAPQLFRRLGARTIPMFCDPDGININAECGSQHPQAMAARVQAEGADLGLAFDGDGDRLIAVDEEGTVLTGDQIMAICANHLMQKDKLRNKAVVSTVMSNMGFHLTMREQGINLTTTKVGDRYVIQEMLNRDAILGGEDSGHIIFNDLHTTGDGLMAAVRLVDALVNGAQRQTLSKMARMMTIFPQTLINVDVASKPDITTIPEIVDAIKAVERDLGDQGRVLVRYSGTQAKCRVMVEGPTPEKTQSMCRQIAEVVKRKLN